MRLLSGEALDLRRWPASGCPPDPVCGRHGPAGRSAEGLQQQLDLLERYCARKSLTVNRAKTKVMLAGRGAHRGIGDGDGPGRQGAVCWQYFGLCDFHRLGLAAVAARVRTAQPAMRDCRAWCAELGLERAPVLMQLYDSLVKSKLPCVWILHLAAGRRIGRSQPSRSSSKEARRRAHRGTCARPPEPAAWSSNA